jgi:hypothetical protein
MAGTAEGARKAVETKRKTYGDKFFAKNGRKGGIARNNSDKKYNPFEDKEFARQMAKKASDIRWAGHVQKGEAEEVTSPSTL